MSKDIWHTGDIKPKSLKTFVYKTDKGHIGSNMLTIDSGWNPILLPEFYSMDDFDKAERITKWAYLDNLLALETENKDFSDKIGKLETELELARKALDVAKDTLHWYNDNYDSVVARNTLDEIKTITALEQKDGK